MKTSVFKVAVERYFPACDRLHEFFLTRRVEPGKTSA